MKKRLFSILLALCMVLCFVPTTAFAESETEEPPVCSCETACTAEAMNTECPVCGVEGALPENCAKCAQPADDAAVQPEKEVSDPQPEGEVSDPQPEGEVSDPQPEGEVSDPQPEGKVSDPQPETALTALIGGNETAKDVSTAEELTAAIADVNFDTVRLASDINIDTTLTVNHTVTLDLNGHVLKYESANNGSVIVVEGSGQLTIEDSNTSNLSHKFNPNGKLWVLDEASGTETVTGGVITGGTGTDLSTYGGTTWYCGGGALIKNGGSLTMRGGNIIGCSAECGGGVCIDSERNGEPGQFSMSGGSIIGCVASNSGGGVFASGKFQMSDKAVIRSCTVESTIQLICGGGVYVNGSSSFEMSDTAKIEGCQAISTSAYGGGVYVSSSSFVMTAKAEIEGCRAISNSANSSKGGGVHLSNNTKFTLSGSAVIQNCTATNSANSGEAYGGGVSAACVKEITLADSARIAGCTAANGSGLYITGSQVPGYGKLFANGGSVDGDVVLGDTEDGPSTITGSGGTVFNGKVTVTPGSTIESGTFNGEVINNGTITGGVFNNTVSGSGTIKGGTFNTPMTGSGTETDPYQISTADQLKLFRDIVNGTGDQAQNRGAYAVLTANIDLKNEEWTPIGIGNGTENNGATIDFPYSGTFDGNGHTISGLNVNYRNKNGGLFCYVMNATIKNLTVAGSVTHSSGDGVAYGGIVGCADSSTIENCTNRCTVTGNWYAGGIVGWSTDSDIIGCANFGNISSPSFSGGICGKIGGENDAAGIDATIRDCYNVGMVSGNYAGGITGQSDSEDIDILIANCYNVGSLHGSTNTGEIIGDLSGPICTTIDNCYYLPTGNPASTSDRVNVKRTDSKTAAEFADGTVRKLLKAGERDNNADPWADECKYLDAAGKTLPVFNGQGDTHDHQSNDWESNETEHWQVCTCGAVFHKAQHSGGTATCTQRATCTVCGAEYGDVLGHDFTTSWTHDDNEHWKQCSRCDEKKDVSPHTWDNGTITIAPTCTKAGERTYTCTECGATKTEPIDATGHSWKSDWTSDATHHWHECANENCDVTDNAGKKGYAEHSGGKATCTQNAVCEFCKASYGSPDQNNHTDLKHIDAKAATAAEEGNIAYWYCDGCKKYFSDKDGTKEIAKADTVTAKLPPKITAGDGAAVTQGEKKELTFTSDASFADFVRVELDGTALEEKNYTKREGSTIITLNRDFVATLSVGEHTLAIVSQHGTATAKFTVKAKPTETATPQPTVTPQPTAQPTQTVQPQPTVQPVSPILRTGDTANPALWFALLIVSGGAAIGITVASRKKKHNK